MREINNPHDKFFKETWTQPGVARAFLQEYLPAAVTELLDLSRMRLVKDTFVDETLQEYLPAAVTELLDLSRMRLVKDTFVDETLHEHFTDLLYEVALREHGELFIGVLFEHKSYLDKLTALQVLRYMVRVWDYGLRQQGRLLPILPIVVYHGPEPWTATTHFQGLFELPAALRPYMPEYQYWLSDLSAYSDAEVKGSVTLQVGWLLLKHIFTPALRERLPEVLAFMVYYPRTAPRAGLFRSDAALCDGGGGDRERGGGTSGVGADGARRRCIDEYDILWQQAQADAQAIIEMIARRYAPQQISQWGSVLAPQHFSEASDIDLAVAGVDSVVFLQLLGDAEALTYFPLDILRWEEVPPAFQKTILAKGKIVYAKD